MQLRSRETLRALMTQEQVSLGVLASAVGVHRSFVSHLLAGRSRGCTEPLAARIADALCVPTPVLFRAEGQPPGRRPEVEARLAELTRANRRR